jgi:hypothetical protein
MHVLFSWVAADGTFPFALVEPELGVRRNAFLDAFDHHRAAGVDLASLEKSLARLPVSPNAALVEWWIDDPRQLRLPPASVVQRIQRLIGQRKATLYFQGSKNSMPESLLYGRTHASKRIAFVGFHPIARTLGDDRRCDHRARNLRLL